MLLEMILKSNISEKNMVRYFTVALGGTTRHDDCSLQPSSAWTRPTVSAFQYFHWCAITKPTVSLFCARYIVCQTRSLVITLYVAVDPSFLVTLCRKYSPSWWLQWMVVIVATDVWEGWRRLHSRFGELVPLITQEICFKCFWNLIGTPLR